VPYALVVGEALVDLLESADRTGPLYRPVIGGAPLNVAVGVARLGGPVELAASVSTDLWGRRIRAFLADRGVGRRALLDTDAPTSLALTAFEGAEPDFHFYGSSYGELDRVDPVLVAGADALYCGSIALLEPRVLAAARAAWAVPGPLRAFDPNVRPRLLRDAAGLRAVVEEFAAAADVVKLSAADAALLYPDLPVADVAARLAGPGAVVVTRGAAGALVHAGGSAVELPAPVVSAVDATGAGDSVMAALLRGLLAGGRPTGRDGWAELTAFALGVAGLVCESPGGATATPTLDAVRTRFPDRVPAALR
jgi:fructokinase